MQTKAKHDKGSVLASGYYSLANTILRAVGWAFICSVAGSALLLAFAPVNAFWVAWIGALPLLCICNISSGNRRLLLGYCFGLGFFCTGLYWLPESARVFFSFSEQVSSLLAFIALGYLALYPALFCWLGGYLSRSKRWLQIIGYPFIWCFLEILKNSVFGGLPWLGLGLTQVEGPLAAFIPVVGEPGVAYLVVLINALLYVAIVQGRVNHGWIKPVIVIVMLFGLAVLLHKREWTNPTGAPQRIAIVQAAVPLEEKWPAQYRAKIIDRYRQLSLQYAHNVDWLIWPETAVPLFADQLQQRYPELTRLTERNQLGWIVGALEPTIDGRSYNSLLLFRDGNTHIYRKQHLAPFGEQVRFPWLMNYLGLSFDYESEKIAGQLPSTVRLNDVAIGAGICWEIRFGGYIARSVNMGATFLINIANEAWTDSSVAHQRSLQLARVRALESGRPLIRVSNRGISVMVDHQGEVQLALPAESPGVAKGELQGRRGLTPFTWISAKFGI